MVISFATQPSGRLVTIAIDAMGGDHAPEATVLGSLQVAATSGVRVLLVGERARLVQLCEASGMAPDVATRVEVVHAPEVIGMDEAPSAALDKKDESSMGVAARLVKEHAADALVSAGNTGALMAVSLFTIGRLPGIRRPAIAVLWPTRSHPVLVLDSGANADSKPEYLVQFAHMGSLYAEHALGRARPRVGLLNIGGEAGKGGSLVNAVYPLLEGSGLNFVGNTEPTAMLAGVADVVVTDGFVGNMILKTGEAVAEMILSMLKQGVAGSLRARVGGLLLRPMLLGVKQQIDQSEYGGAPFLGLQGLVIKAHGRANERAIGNAVKVAVRAAQSRVVELIAKSIGKPRQPARAATEGGSSLAGTTPP